MLVRPADLEQMPEVQQEVAPEAEVATPEVAPEEAAVEAPIEEAPAQELAAPEAGETASEQAFGDKPTAQSGQIDGGMYEPEEYQAACESAGTPDKWDPKYAHGHTEAAGWTQPYEGRYDMAFELKKGHSASQAVRDFLAGPTIADFQAIGVAIEMDELRDELGDHKFDQMFGSRDSEADNKISRAQRLKITSSMYTIPFAQQMLALAAENESLDNKPTEEEAPAVEARQELKPEQAGVTAESAPPEMIADELGVQREQEFA
ncbi:MAG TPA: hypothetical protein VGC42_26690 [Kofleriaceae bacterium]